MNVPPILLLTIGCVFSVAYGLFITIGWAITRKNRKIYQQTFGISLLSYYDLKERKVLDKKVRSVSLDNNFFQTSYGEKINIEEYKAYIASGHSSTYPGIEDGDLILLNFEGKIEFAFEIPNLKNYR